MCACSTQQAPNRHRTIASEDTTSCLESSLDNHHKKICQFAFSYLSEFTKTPLLIQAQLKDIESQQIKVLQLNIQVAKNDIDHILGRGGLRVRYLRYLLNELSYFNQDRHLQNKNYSLSYVVEIFISPQEV